MTATKPKKTRLPPFKTALLWPPEDRTFRRRDCAGACCCLIIVLFIFSGVICGGFALFEYCNDVTTPSSNSAELLDQLLNYDVEFLNDYNRHFGEWIRGQNKRGSTSARLGCKLNELTVKHKQHLKEFSGNDDIDAFRADLALHMTKQAHLSPAELWNRTEIYLMTVSYRRIVKLADFIAQFMANPDVKTSAPVFLDHLHSFDHILGNLTEKAGQFWQEFKLNTVPGIKRNCLVFKDTAPDVVDTVTVLENLKTQLLLRQDHCIPPGQHTAVHRRRETVKKIVAYTILVVLLFCGVFYCGFQLGQRCHKHLFERRHTRLGERPYFLSYAQNIKPRYCK